MKNFFMFLLSALFITGCVNDGFEEIAVQEKKQQEVVDSFYVSYETALKYARNVLADTMQTRVAARSVANHYEYVANKITRSANDDVEVRFHVINFEDNQGFALVSADSRATPVYAYSETGNIDLDDAIENSGFGDFMDAAIEYYIMETSLKDSIGGQLLPKDPTLPLTPVPTNPILQLPIVEQDGIRYHVCGEDIKLQNPGGVLVDVEWNQCWPYNYYCERNENAIYYYGYRNAAGCGPVAAGQIMSHFRYPKSYNGVVFDWNLVLSLPYYNEPYFYYENCSDGAKATSKLLKEIGVCAGVMYGITSGMPLDRTDDMFREFGYLCEGPSDFTIGKVKTSLDSYGPVYMTGGKNGSYHAWVIDSYKQWKTVTTYYHSYEPYLVAFTTTTMHDVYYHCNWGWGPGSSAWLLDVFDGYSSNNMIIYNIRPDV